MLRMGLRQGFRAPRKLAAYFLVTLLVCSFLTIGLNLKQAADSNMEAVLSGFNVMAMPDFKGYIDENGHLAPTLRESVGYFPCFAENYDIEKLRSLAGVQKLDARNQFGACVNNKNGALYTMRISSQQSLRYQQMDVPGRGDVPRGRQSAAVDKPGFHTVLSIYIEIKERRPRKRGWTNETGADYCGIGRII